MGWKRGLGVGLLFVGLFLSLTAKIITGAVVGFSSKNLLGLLGILLLAGGIILILFGRSKTGKLEKTLADKHASERMSERKLFPVIIKETIKQGVHYKLNSSKYRGTKGATEAYVLRNCADIAPGGAIGGRILKVGGKREYKNVIVLTDRNQKVKTTYVRNDTELRAFLRRYAA